MQTATELLLSYPDDLDDPDRQRLRDSSFRSYLRRTHERAREGDVWNEFVGRGCGSTRDVALLVEHVEGGPALAESTEIEYVSREQAATDGAGDETPTGAGE